LAHATAHLRKVKRNRDRGAVSATAPKLTFPRTRGALSA
jgi:hypothetical protein